MAKQYVSLKCPFCNKGDIELIYFPSTVKFVKGPWGGSKPEGKLSSDSTIVKTEKCPSCGKTDKEIKKALDKGKTVSHEERLRRLRESGLPMMIVNKRK